MVNLPRSKHACAIDRSPVLQAPHAIARGQTGKALPLLRLPQPDYESWDKSCKYLALAGR
jgi:hypothetical protein